MKILLMRHGEAMDDIHNTFGGWADDPLSENGKNQAVSKVESIRLLGIPFAKIYTSPLKRAHEVGVIIGNSLGLPTEKLEYAAEFNGYGILSGMSRELAEQKYPDQLTLLKQTGEALKDLNDTSELGSLKVPFVDGAESIYSVVNRVKKTIKLIESSGNENVILVTHGGIIGIFYKLFLHKEKQKTEDCGWVLLKSTGDGSFIELINQGVE
jgi:broad specificity phosphatase PhoE